MSRRDRRRMDIVVGQLMPGLIGGLLLLLDSDLWLAWLFINLFAVGCLANLGTLPHELGHALAGRWVGASVEGIVIGMGPPLFRVRLLGFNVLVRAIPLGGVTHCQFVGRHPSNRLGRGFVYLAGPLASLALAGVAFVHFFADEPLAIMPTARMDLWALFVLANVFGGVLQLSPAFASTPWGVLPNDGMSLARLVFASRGRSPVTRPSTDRSSPSDVATTPGSTAAIDLARYLVGPLSVCFGCAFVIRLVRFLVGGPVTIAFWSPLGLGVSWIATITLLYALRGGDRDAVPLGTDRGALAYDYILRTFAEELAARHGLSAGVIFSMVRIPELARQGDGEIDSALGRLADSLGCVDDSEGRFLDSLRAVDHTPDWLGEALGEGDEGADLFGGQRRCLPDVALRFFRARLLLHLGRPDEAEVVAASCLAVTDLSSATRTVLIAMLLQTIVQRGEFDRALTELDRHVVSLACQTERSYVMDYVACLPLAAGQRGFLNQAERIACRARELDPDNLSLKGTHGSLLVELGRLDEGEWLLREVFAEAEASIDEGLSALYLAVCCNRRDRAREAMKLARHARLVLQERWVTQRIAEEFSEVPR